jgi:hypothetical protein
MYTFVHTNMANRMLTWAGPGPWARPRGCRLQAIKQSAYMGRAKGPGPAHMSTLLAICMYVDINIHIYIYMYMCMYIDV